LNALPNSEFTLRRTMKDLTRWCHETLGEESKILSNECRLFLVDRLARELQRTLESGGRSQILAPQLKTIANELKLSEALQAAAHWIEALGDNRVRAYIDDTVRLLASVGRLVSNGEHK
jgi:EAL domain-containing protein (putative c-di-GMP-specific phosphodiesterase class I)